MGYKELKAEFEGAMDGKQHESEAGFRYWMLRLLFEINGNLDALSVAYRELVKLQRERKK